MEKTKNAWLITFALKFVGKKELRALKKAAKDCGATEEATLRAILEYAKDTEWGRAHNFASILQADSRDELLRRWRENSPVTGYEDFRPFVERHKHGEQNLLFPGKPKMYATTSGTTSEPKWIPITPVYIDNIYKRMNHLWLYTFIMHRPKCYYGRTLSIVGKSVECLAPDGTPCGSVSGVTRDDCPDFIRAIHSSPMTVFGIKDYKARYYVLIRTAVEQNVSVLITANPSTVLELQKNLENFFDDYLDDIEHGTLSRKVNIEPDIRAALEPLYKPNPRRAEELRAIKKEHPEMLPKHYWPNFQLLNTWKLGNTAVYADKFKDWFPENALHLEFGYFASECRFGLVMNGKNDTVPFAHFHFFEFTSADDIGKPNPRFMQLSDLEVGKRYCVYITTFAGLYRYDMNDIVECTGKFGTIPTLQFIQKTKGIISMTGEKLHESQFVQAVKDSEKSTGRQVRFFSGFADLAQSVYHFYFEFADDSVSRDEADGFARAVDGALKSANVEYKAKRDSFRVKDPIAHVLKKDSFEAYKEMCISRGANDGQFKMMVLSQDDKRRAMFEELSKK